MNKDLSIETREIGNHRIAVYYDDTAECPVTAWSLGGSYLFEYLEHGRYRLSSECDWREWVSSMKDRSMADLLRLMAAQVVKQQALIDYYKAGKVKGFRFIYNRNKRLWQLQSKAAWRGDSAEWEVEFEVKPSEVKAYECKEGLLEHLGEEDLLQLIAECANDFVIKRWSSSGYSQGDNMRGVAYMSKQQFGKRCGFNPEHYKSWQEQALEVIDAEIKAIEMWAWGDVKGFVLEKKVSFTKVFDDGREAERDYEWEYVDSCWGYFMDTEELINEVIAEHNLKETEI